MHTVWLVFTLCILVWLDKNIFIEFPILSRGPTQFVDIYPELVVQHNVSIQVDKPVACSSPVEPGTPLMADDSTTSFPDYMYAQTLQKSYICTYLL